tara:strand:- start:297 stop:473 length:177 start_codon:yes stop_codon:yes gene_type:complete
MDVVVLPGFVSERECPSLSERARAMWQDGALMENPRGPALFFRKIHETAYADGVVSMI